MSEMQVEPQEPRQPVKPIRYVWIILVLVILPGISWFYLKYGFEYQKRVRSELRSFGPAPAFSFEGWNRDSLQGHLTILSFPSDSTTMLSELEGLHHQFDQSSEMRFISLYADSAQQRSFDKWMQLDPPQWKWIYLPAEQWQALQAQLSKQVKMGHPNANAVFVFDPKGELREIYDLRNMHQIRQLIEHVAMLAPRDPDEHVEIKRTTER